MKIKILTHNVRGLNDPLAVANLRTYIQRNPVDVLFIQEHKLRGNSIANLGRQVWKRAKTFFTEAEPGYNTDGSNSGKGGIATFISPRWANHITQTGSLFGGRVQWVILSKLPRGDLGFLNLYAPSTCSLGNH